MPRPAIIGIRREDKNRWERRVPIVPDHAEELVRQGFEVRVQASPNRAFSDDEYRAAGAKIVDDLAGCDPIFAVKELPLAFIEAGKTYVFFSHIIKGQAHNMPMLGKLMDLGCNVIDYEKMIDERGRRLVFFGRFAGLAGMIDTLWALGARLDSEGISSPFSAVKRAHEYPSLADAERDIGEVGRRIEADGLPEAVAPLVIGFAGYGNVSQGAQHILDLLPVDEVPVERLAPEFPNGAAFESKRNRVFKIVFREEHMVAPLHEDQPFDLQDYYKNPHRYRGVFEKHLPYFTVLANCIYWDARYPRLVTKSGLKRLYEGSEPPRLRVLGDISCDVDGAFECNLKTMDPGDAVFVYDPWTGEAADGTAGAGPVVLSVDNLPAELPRDSSVEFSRALFPFVPGIANADMSGPLESCGLPGPIRAALEVYHGELTPEFSYIDKFLGGRKLGSRPKPEPEDKTKTDETQGGDMKKILLLGAGMVTRPLTRYLLKKGYQLTIASRTVSKAEALIEGHPNGKALTWTVDKEAELDAMVRDCDLAISLLPAAYHVMVAKACIKHKKQMVTTSYVKPEMQALDQEAKDAGVLILNEIGVDPGIDHMSAMKIIHDVEKAGGKIVSFKSYCGGLPAPEHNDNPWGYKFSWSPISVLLAGKNDGRYIKEGKEVYVPGPELFPHNHTLEVPDLCELEAYTNRDCLGYIDLYGLKDAKTVFRGTLRYKTWCETLKKIADSGLLDDEKELQWEGKTYKDYTAQVVPGAAPETAKADFAKHVGLAEDSEPIKKLEWLGLFSDDKVQLKRGERPTSLRILATLMEERMPYKTGEKDMIVMHHEFIAEYPDKSEKLTSTLLDFGVSGTKEDDTSMARTVSLPAAMAAHLILQGRIKATGVHIPVSPVIYEPVLKELEEMEHGIKFVERKHDLKSA